MSTFPNSTVTLYSGVKLSNDQNDTFYFDSQSSQESYFNSLPSISVLSNQYRIEPTKNVIKIQLPYSRVYKVNYMRFKNTSYENKWFYAFVTKIDYINETTSAITYEIDYIQTWFFNYEIDECFVEREHTITDNIGEHIEPEKLALGEYVLNGDPSPIANSFSDTAIVVVYNKTGNVEGRVYDGAFSTSIMKVWRGDEEGGVAEFINSVTDMNEIQNIYMCPLGFFRDDIGGGQAAYGRQNGRYYLDIKDAITAETTIDSYKPKNNKLYTYPYNFFRVDTPDGDCLITRYELFEELRPRFAVTTSITMPVEMNCFPIFYKNQQPITDETAKEPITVVRTEKLSIKGFPMCNWATPYYSEWLAQNSVPRAINFSGDIISSTIGLSTTPLLPQNTQALSTVRKLSNTGSNIVSSVANWFADDYSASIHANITHGSLSTGNNDFSCGRMHFEGARVSITAEYAKRIDDYFTAFGYGVGRLKEPSRHNRSRFTYVKTVGANVHGNLPVDAADAIASYYNNGIRFWADHSGIGTYTEANEPLQ